MADKTPLLPYSLPSEPRYDWTHFSNILDKITSTVIGSFRNNEKQLQNLGVRIDSADPKGGHLFTPSPEGLLPRELASPEPYDVSCCQAALNEIRAKQTMLQFGGGKAPATCACEPVADKYWTMEINNFAAGMAA